MKERSQSIPILIADDDPEDREMIHDAFRESRVANDLYFVQDGQELIDFLEQKGRYSDPASAPLPGLILLDLNMPKKDGREALAEIKAHPKFKLIPVIVLTTSKAESDIFRTYNLGVNSFITKPVTFEALVQVTNELGKYWLEIVELPHLDRD